MADTAVPGDRTGICDTKGQWLLAPSVLPSTKLTVPALRSACPRIAPTSLPQSNLGSCQAGAAAVSGTPIEVTP